MPRHTTLKLTPDTWVELTDADVTAISLQNVSAETVEIAGTVSATPPASDEGAYRLTPSEGLINTALADLWPGIAAVRVFARAQAPAQIMVSHA